MLKMFKDGRYVFLEELDIRGGFGVVYKVNDTKTNELRAMKQIHAGAPDATSSSTSTDEMIMEAKLLKKLKSNYIIQYVDYFREDFFHYIVTELANDGDLAKRIARYKAKGKTFSEDIVIFWATQLLKGERASRVLFYYYLDIYIFNSRGSK
jgi:serine/threonine protein kinase